MRTLNGPSVFATLLTTTTTLIIAAVVGSGLTLGCSDDAKDPLSTPQNNAPPDAGSEAATTTSKSSFTIWTYETPIGTEPPAPLGGATIAFDPADGTDRIELQTSPDGRAVVEADFTKGGGTVTVFAKDHVLYTTYGASPGSVAKIGRNHLDKAAGELVLFLGLDAAGLYARTVKLSGSITNKVAASDRISLGASVLATSFDDTSATYEMRVLKGKPFLFLGSEYTFAQPDARSAEATIKKFFKLDRPALDGDATFDLDVTGAPEVAVVTNKIHLVLPGGDAGPFGGTSVGRVNVSEPLGLFTTGVSRKMAPSADKNGFDCEVTVAQVDLGALSLITQGSLANRDGSASIRSEVGVLPDGSSLDGFLAPPTITFDKVKLADPIPTDGIPAEASAVQLRLLVGQAVVWAGIAFRDVGLPGSLVVPKPPTGATIPASTTGQLVALAEPMKLATGAPYPKKVSVSRPFAVSR